MGGVEEETTEPTATGCRMGIDRRGFVDHDCAKSVVLTYSYIAPGSCESDCNFIAIELLTFLSCD